MSADVAIFLITADLDWSRTLAGRIADEGLGRAEIFPSGRGALAAFKRAQPDMVLFDLRSDTREILVALSMLVEIYPRMAEGGVCFIGAADPDDREALRREREQLLVNAGAEYLPRDVSASILVERVHGLVQRAEERRSERAVRQALGGVEPHPPGGRAPMATPSAPVPVAVEGTPAPAAAPPPLPQVALLLEDAKLAGDLAGQLAPLAPRRHAARELWQDAVCDALPEVLLIDAPGAELHGELLTRLLQRRPELRIMQLPDTGDRVLRRLPREVCVLLQPAGVASPGPAEIARLLLQRLQAEAEGRPQPVMLLAEDEQNIRELTAHYLLLQGYEVHQAEDGQEALLRFKARRPDLVLSDVYMPRMNGFKLLLEIKNRDGDLPVLMMTGYSSAAQVLSTSKYRNVHFLPKPYRLSELGEKVRQMLGAVR
jgi:DNA-binding response OmpR family regulator